MPVAANTCQTCKQFVEIPLLPENDIICPSCSAKWGRVDGLPQIWQQCPVCQCRQFYTQKDFNQALGCAVMLVGIVLVPFTFGLSLPVFAFIDWMIYRRIPTIAVCYRCLTEFKGLPIPDRFKPFLHHIGEKYDRKQAKKSE